MSRFVRFTAFAGLLGATIFAAHSTVVGAALAQVSSPPTAGSAIAADAQRGPPTRPPIRLAQAEPTPQPAAPQPKPPKKEDHPAEELPVRSESFRFDGWVATCNEFEGVSKRRVCSAQLQIFDQKTHQAVFSWNVGLDNNKQVVAVFQTPTGVSIEPGLELRVGKSPARKIPFTSCDAGRCIATTMVDGNLLKDLTTSTTAHAVIRGEAGNAVEFNIEIKGFDKAYAVLSRPG